MLPKIGVWVSYGFAGIGLGMLLIAFHYSYQYWNNIPTEENERLTQT